MSESDGDGYRLQVSFALLPPDGGKPQPLGKPQVLLTGIRSGQFSYRGRERNHQPTGWMERWQDTDRTPVLVRLELKLRPRRLAGAGGADPRRCQRGQWARAACMRRILRRSEVQR